MRSIIQWAVRSPSAMNLIMLASLLVGVIALVSLRREVFPNFQLEIIVVAVPYPGASPEEVEEAICQKVEAAIRSVDGIKTVTSVARESVGFAVVELTTSADVQRALADIRSEIDRIPSFPLLAEDPEIEQITFRTPAIRVGILAEPSDAADAELQLRAVAEEVRDDLLNLRTVSQANIVGERPYQIDVEISEQTLRKYNLTLQRVADILRRENIEIPGGKIQTAGQTLLLRAKNKRLTGAEIAEIPLVTRPDGTRLTVSDLGNVYDGFEDSISYQRLQGQPALVVSVDRTSNEDLIAIVDDVKAYAATKQLPPGYSLITMNDTSVDVRERIELLTEDGLQGLLLVFLVLAIFLEFRLALWVAMGIPFAILATCAVIFFAGETLNMLTLFSFLMALGILVDDAIVISENFHTHRAMGKSLVRAAIDATVEVAPSVTVGVMCTVIAFVPLFFVSGVMGKFIACMPLTVIAMLLISLAEGLTILACHLGHDGMLEELMGMCRRIEKSILRWNPLHLILVGLFPLVAAFLTRQVLGVMTSIFYLLKSVFDVINRWSSRFVQFVVTRLYLPAVRRALANIPVVLALALAFMMITATALSAGWIKRVLFPSLDSRVIYASLVFPDGTPIEVTDAAVEKVAAAIRRINDRYSTDEPLVRLVHEAVGSSVGLNFGPAARAEGESTGGVFVELCGADHRDLTSAQLLDLWRQETESIVGIEELEYASATMGPGGRDIEFKLVADKRYWDQLEKAAAETVAELQTYSAVARVNDDLYEGKWEYQIRVNDRARGMGVSTAELAETVRASFYGEEAMRLQRGSDEVKLMVRYPPAERNNLVALENIRVRGDDGVERPISELADVNIVRGYSEIQRVDQQRAITIWGDIVEGGNANEVIGNLQSGFTSQLLAKYPNVRIQWEGQKQQDSESLGSLGLGAAVAIFAMYLLLVFQLKSLIEPFIVLCIIPFAAAGAVWGHYVMGLELTLFSFFGLVALTGMVVNDSIVLLDFINSQISDFPNRSLIESIVEAGRRRIRPMALNTVTSIIGIVPLVSNTSFQAQVLVPMGVSLVFGLAASTLVGLFLIPTLYYMVAQIVPPRHNSATDLDDEGHGAGVETAAATARFAVPAESRPHISGLDGEPRQPVETLTNGDGMLLESGNGDAANGDGADSAATGHDKHRVS